ncbi:MAG: glycine cleavage system protein H [Candidatus Bathyarchaeia archaeon]
MVKVGDYELREDLSYWSHGQTWAKLEPDGRVRVGLTDLAQKLAGKIRFIRIQRPGKFIDQGKGFATMETGKWVGPLEAPISGTIEETNPALRRKPQALNTDPYGDGWIALLKPSKPEELQGLVHGEGLVDWYKKEIETREKDKKK